MQHVVRRFGLQITHIAITLFGCFDINILRGEIGFCYCFCLPHTNCFTFRNWLRISINIYIYIYTRFFKKREYLNCLFLRLIDNSCQITIIKSANIALFQQRKNLTQLQNSISISISKQYQPDDCE